MKLCICIETQRKNLLSGEQKLRRLDARESRSYVERAEWQIKRKLMKSSESLRCLGQRLSEKARISRWMNQRDHARVW